MMQTRPNFRLLATALLVAAAASMPAACSDGDDVTVDEDDPTTSEATTSSRPPTTAPSTGEPVGGNDSTDLTTSIELQATELDTVLQFDSYVVEGSTITGTFPAGTEGSDVESQCVTAMDLVEPGTTVVLRYPDREVTCASP